MTEDESRRRRVASRHAAARSSTEKVVGLIDLFTEDAPRWTIDSMAARLRLARTTAYRYAKTLVDARFLASISQGLFVLARALHRAGPADRPWGDPLLRIAPPIMRAIRDDVSGIQLLCSY